MGLVQAAKMIGVRYVTLRRWHERGVVAGRRWVTPLGAVRYQFDLEEIERIKAGMG